ncbi:TetR family transcriptional regulator [Amycolatopsis sp. WAC 01376]|uniref:TetR/AcrR family transcriptional regulator n=1 Tax=Amycolatopsis sp. WAC 01376 TaxID=2203195 RepID=UPI000F780D2D|nr:TetR/AcrR family transcriptional regulator [Amycolatopsis sp. WAC 01376]RSM55168.1 TetR family transcriptional regulator [Amycolatopsis sp. WAC 01376]
MTSARRSRGRPRDPHADELIMKTALELFAERGVEGANFEQIAKRAGVAKVTIYRRWSSKEELLTQAIEQARTLVPEAEIWAAADPSARQPDERLMESWTGTFGDTRFRAVLAQLIGSSVSHPALLATYREQYIEPRRQVILAALEQSKKDGQLAEEADIDSVIDMVVGAAMYRMLIDPATADDPATTRRYLDDIVRQANRLLQPHREEQT